MSCLIWTAIAMTVGFIVGFLLCAMFASGKD